MAASNIMGSCSNPPTVSIFSVTSTDVASSSESWSSRSATSWALRTKDMFTMSACCATKRRSSRSRSVRERMLRSVSGKLIPFSALSLVPVGPAWVISRSM